MGYILKNGMIAFLFPWIPSAAIQIKQKFLL